MSLKPEKLTEDNVFEKAYRFRDRQAGVSVVFDPSNERYSYNAYCLEMKLLKELYSVEYEFLSEAIDRINEEFGTWKLESLSDKPDSGCGSCIAH